METIKLSNSEQHPNKEFPETVAAIGFFDGIHKGHQKVIDTAVKEAKENQIQSAVITFYPHPSVVLKQNENAKYITPLHIKEDILENLHVDFLYIITFDKDLSLLSPQEFINQFITKLNIKHLVAGFDFTFGYKGEGNMANISDLALNDFSTTVIDKLTCGNEKISSTHIRELLSTGQMEKVNQLLNRQYLLEGKVVSGDQRGRTIGYPTANIKVKKEVLLPKPGVYAVKVKIENRTYKAMANLGVRPTFHPNDSEPIIEVHIFNFNKDIYGKHLYIEWFQFVREEKKFSNIDSLIQQIQQDEKDIRAFFRR